MNKQEIYDFIKSKNIWYEITEHKVVFNMEELSEIEIPHPEYDAKNLFIRDDKKRNYYLIVINKKLIAVQDRNKHNKPIYAYGVCKTFILCEIIGGEFKKNIETTEIEYFALNELPNNLA